MLSAQFTALALAGMLLVVNGCGGSTVSSKTLTRAELIAKASAICGRVNERRELITIRKPQDYLTLLRPFAAYEQSTYAELDKLTPPHSLVVDWRELVMQAHTIARDSVTIGAYAKAGRMGSARALLEALNPLQKRMDGIAIRNGIKECAEAD
jgi:hypothetical protein